MKLEDGPGRCAGRLEIQRGEESFPVAVSESIKESLPHICNLLECGNDYRVLNNMFSPGSGDFFKWVVNCGTGAESISDCIQPNTITNSGQNQALMLVCEGEQASR